MSDRVFLDTNIFTLGCLILAPAEDADAELVTFDSEILDAGGTPPSELLD